PMSGMVIPGTPPSPSPKLNMTIQFLNHEKVFIYVTGSSIPFDPDEEKTPECFGIDVVCRITLTLILRIKRATKPCA
ncbi:hypothetical protein CHS0354_026521, partial [Potamilus streckersoni]